jgi:peptidoglycan pentaglycine glycine transferase (the first glycine)
MYKLREITSKDIWNNFIIEGDFEFYSFLSSWEWYSLQEKSNKKVFRFWIYRNEILIGVIPFIKNEAKRWIYIFCPHTPLILEKYSFFEVLEQIKNEIVTFWKKEKANFIRLNSPVQNLKENKKRFEKLGFINAPMHEHAEDTHLLDLNKTEDKLLQNIKKKDRYYINRAIKEWVDVIKGNNKKQREILTNMHIEHSKKVWYHPFSKKFIDSLYEVFSDNITTISTKYEWKIESILMTIRFWKTCVYYIATSDITNHKFSPNYLCQWEAIKQAKKDWCSIYNFWGISPDNNPKHPIAWVTKFKKKFWGYDYSLLHAQDLPLTQIYWFNWIIETIRRKKRGYYYKKAS